MKRQRGRNRSGGGGGGGGGKQSHNVNRAFDSNGPDNVKIRGHAQHVYEKYQQLARDASASGDRVLAENYLQHAEHYFRVLRTIQPQRPASEIVGRDAFSSGFDIDFDEDGEGATEEAEAAPEAGEGGEGRREERQDRGERQERGEWRREDRGERQDREFRGEGRDRQDRGERGEGREGRRDRYEGRRDERGPREGRGYGQREERAEAPRDEQQPAAEAEAPVARSDEPMLRAQDGAVSQAPAFLQAPAADEGEGRRTRTRARRRPRSFEPAEGGEAPAPTGGEEA